MGLCIFCPVSTSHLKWVPKVLNHQENFITNPLVHFLSRIRPPLIIKEGTFLFRVWQEAGLPPGVTPEAAIRAVFSATKDELSQDRIEDVGSYLPGIIRQMWEEA